MKKIKKSWIAVVTGALLLGTLVGVVWARPNDRPEAQDITRKVTLGGANFIPSEDYQDWGNRGDFATCDSGTCTYTAPVVFPCLPSVTVERIKLHVRDFNGGASVTASLRRTNPATGAEREMGSATSGNTGDSIQTFTSDPINQVVWPSQGAYIQLDFGDKYILVYGVTVEYHRNL
jgi:hypothetical protein